MKKSTIVKGLACVILGLLFVVLGKNVCADEGAGSGRTETVVADFSDINDWKLNSDWTYTQLSEDGIYTEDQNGSLKLVGTRDGEIELKENISFPLVDYTGFELNFYTFDHEYLDFLDMKHIIKGLDLTFLLDNQEELTVSFGANDVITRSWTGQALSFKNIDGYEENKDASVIGLRIKVTKFDDIENSKFYQISFDNLKFINSTAGKVMFTADDGTEDQFTLYYPILKKRGIKGNIAVISERIQNNAPGHMNEEQILTLYNDGFDLLNHSSLHWVPMPYLPIELQLQQFNECKDYLDSIGATRTSNYAVYQGGLYTPELVQVLKENGYVWGRSTHFGVETNLELGNFNSKVRDLQNTVSAETAISYVTDAIDTGNTVIFMNHHITEDDSKLDDPLYWKAEWLEALCDYVKQKTADGSVEVITASEIPEK